MLSKKELITIVDAHITEKNAQYHAEMKKIIEEVKQKLDLQALRDKFVAQIKENPRRWSLSQTVEVNLDPLFRDTNIFVMDEESKKMKYIPNPIPPLEIWLDSPKPPVAYGGDYLHENSFGGIKRVILDKNNHNAFRYTFSEYLLTTDPDVQDLRRILQDAFPEATFHPFVFIHTGSPANLRIEINYTIDNYSHPAIEKHKLCPTKDNVVGNTPIWHRV